MKKSILTSLFAFAITLGAHAQTEAVDVTSYIVNPDFEEGLTGWTAEGYQTQTNNGLAAKANSYYCEKWVWEPTSLPDIECVQTVTLPNGVYLFTIYAAAIRQLEPDAVPKGVTVFAGDSSVAVTNVPTVVRQYRILTTVTGGTLTFGQRVRNSNCNWALLDDAHLYSYGDMSFEEAQAATARDDMRQLVALAEALMAQPMQTALLEAFNINAERIDERTVDDATAALTEMQAQYEEMQAQIAAYAAMGEMIGLCYEGLADATQTFGKDELQEAVATAEGQLLGCELDAGQMTKAVATLRAALDAYYNCNLTGEEVLDYTDHIVNPTVISNTRGWTATTSPSQESGVQEFFNLGKEVDIHQTISGLPDGKYTVTVQALFRPGDNDSGAAHRAGKEKVEAYLYANGQSTRLHSLYDYTAEEMGITGGIYNGYVNLRSSANEAFGKTNPADGVPYFTNSLDVTVLGGELTIGLKADMGAANSWLPFRNFTLSYWGYFPGIVLQGTIDKIIDFLSTNATVQRFDGLCILLEDACLEYEDYTDLDDKDEVNRRCEELETLFASVQQAVEKVADIEELLQQALALLEGGTQYPGTEKLLATYDEVQEFIDGGGTDTTTPQTMDTYLQLIADAITDYHFSQEASRETPADYNFLLTNPDVRTSSTGWSGTMPTISYSICEIFNKDFDFHQTVQVPNGVYRVSVTGFYRQGGNDGGSRYAGGDEVVTAWLYANDATVPMLSLSCHTAEEFGSTSNYNGYVNDMANASFAFDDGLYQGLDGKDRGNSVETIVYDGSLTIGLRNANHETSSWAAFRDFRLEYLGEATAEDISAAWQEACQQAGTMLGILLGTDKQKLQAPYDQAVSMKQEGRDVEAVQLLNAAIAALAAEYAATNAFFSGSYKVLHDMYADGETSEALRAFVSSIIALADERLAAVTASSALLPWLESTLAGYVAYIRYYKEVEDLIVSGNYTAYVDDVLAMMDDHRGTLSAQLYGMDTTAEFIERLRAQTDVMLIAAVVYDLKEGDVTEILVKNPTIDDKSYDGWTIEKGTGNGPANAGEHYSGEPSNSYLDSYNSAAGGLNFSAYQTINGLPNGLYALSCAARTDGDNAYIFATPDSICSASTLFAPIGNNGNIRGDIWVADSLLWAESGAVTDIFSANFGQGFGWNRIVVDNIPVTAHRLTFGVTTNSKYAPLHFTGYWVSADDWKLTLVKKGDNSGQWEIDNAVLPPSAAEAIEYYSLDGLRLAVPGGCCIVRSIGSDGTVTVRKQLFR